VKWLYLSLCLCLIGGRIEAQNRPMSGDASYNVLPLLINGNPPNLPAGSKVDGVPISGGGSTTFLGLTDTPSSYSGQGLKVVRVNVAENALEFASISGTPGGSDTQVQRNNAGAFGGITNATSDGTTLTLTSPKIVTAINDTNGNKILQLTPIGSAVNFLDILNATSGSPTVTVDAAGASTDVNLKLIPKGSGTVSLHNTLTDISVLYPGLSQWMLELV